MKLNPSSVAGKKKPKAPKRMYLHRHANGSPPVIERNYEHEFRLTPDYKDSLPDMMEAVDAIEGAPVAIQQVGISNFRLPLRFSGAVKDAEPVLLEASVTGTVSLAADLKGINMSRIMRSFYDHKEEVFTLELLKKILAAYRKEVVALEARVRVGFSFPLVQESLRSGLKGFQYYRCAYEGTMDRNGGFKRFVEFDFIYSSACPCSAELVEHARDVRGAYGIPHSQRSKARVRLEIADGKKISLKDIHALCLRALRTETQVMVKREDEQAFAELNGTHIKFVEDAARLLFREFNADVRIRDFQIVCSHLESLHSHDAVSVIAKGVPGGFAADFMDFASLIC